MESETAQALTERLDALLDEERSALLNGDLTTIGPLLPRKEALIDALNAARAEAQIDLTRLRGKVTRNQVLLDGALQGIRAVAGRLAAFRKVHRTLETYDQAGRKTAISNTVEHKMEKHL